MRGLNAGSVGLVVGIVGERVPVVGVAVVGDALDGELVEAGYGPTQMHENWPYSNILNEAALSKV